MKTCPKCGHARTPADAAPDYECPKCGVVYAKATARPAAARPERPQSSERRKFVAGAFLFAAAGTGAAWWWSLRSARKEIVADVRGVTGEMLSAINFGNRTVADNARFSDDAIAAVEGYRKKWFSGGPSMDAEGDQFRRVYADAIQRSITTLKTYIGAKVSVNLQIAAPAIIKSDDVVDAAIARRDDLQVQLANELAALSRIVSRRPGYVPEEAVFGQERIRDLAARMGIQIK